MSIVLKNAPLTEVVFELRWEGTQTTTNLPLGFDPASGQLFDRFNDHAFGVGFSRTLDIYPPYAGTLGAISRRYFSTDQQFPLLQIGHGVFASNASTEYDWPSFKERSIGAASNLVASYPRLHDRSLNFVQAELRYLDTFDESVTNSSDLVNFINSATNLELRLSDFLNVPTFSSQRNGRLILDFEVNRPAGAKFTLDIASASFDSTPVIRMETKVTSAFQKVLPSGSKIFPKKLREWLDAAHDLTSPAFVNVMKPSILERFK